MKAILTNVAFTSSSTPIRFTTATSSFLPRFTSPFRPIFSQPLYSTHRIRRTSTSISPHFTPTSSSSSSSSSSTDASTTTSYIDQQQQQQQQQQDKNQVRVRFAPSPTGTLHVGGARTALYNWLLAKQQNGKFIIRVEDTDEARSTRESEEMVLNDLRWLGLDWQEGPVSFMSTNMNNNNEEIMNCGPYRQSERGDIYQRFAKQLIDQGKAYPCFCTEEELESKRKQAEAEGRPPQYDGTWRDADENEVSRRLAAGEPHTIRFRVPPASRVIIDDVVRGKVAWDADATVGDFILLRSNGMPVYNFCVAVDDALMKVSTVIRAEEHLTNTLRQVLILRALDFPIPQYAHCSLILGTDRSKLSKRHGATSVNQFKLEGYLPQAMINYLAALGWNDGTEKEIYTVEEIINAFDISRLTKSPTMFDIDKLRFINGQHLRALPSTQVEQLVLPLWIEHGILTDVITTQESRLPSVAISLVHGSLELTNDAIPQLKACMTYPLEQTVQSDEAKELVLQDEEQGHDGGFKQIAQIVLRDYDEGIMPIGDKGEEHAGLWKKWVKTVGKETGRKGKRLFHPLRLALTGKMSGPDVGTILEMLYLAEQMNAAPNMVPLKTRIETLRSLLSSM